MSKLRVLVACEYSGTVRRAFQALGHYAMSCDLLPADDASVDHYQGDIFDVVDRGWDLMIAHPPCTYLANSGVSWLHRQPDRWAKMEDGARFFRALLDLPIPYKAIENPIMHKYALAIVGERQSQVIQPWMFGHAESKATCLWLRNLPLLRETQNVRQEMLARPKAEAQRLHWLPPSPTRWKERSKTYDGIAAAMAQQWSTYICEKGREAA